MGQQGIDNQKIIQIGKTIVQILRVTKFFMQENSQIAGVKLAVFVKDNVTVSGYEASQLFNFSLNSEACGGVNKGNFEISLALYPSLETDWIYVWLVQAGAGMVSSRNCSRNINTVVNTNEGHRCERGNFWGSLSER